MKIKDTVWYLDSDTNVKNGEIQRIDLDKEGNPLLYVIDNKKYTKGGIYQSELEVYLDLKEKHELTLKYIENEKRFMTSELEKVVNKISQLKESKLDS